MKFCSQNLVLLEVVDNQLTNQVIGMLILCPARQLNGCIINIMESTCNEFGTCRDDIGTHIILHALRGLTLCQCKNLVNEDFLQAIHLVLIFLVVLRQNLFVLSLRSTSLDGLREKFLVNHDTSKRWGCLERRILHIARLVTKDGTKQLLFRCWI